MIAVFFLVGHNFNASEELLTKEYTECRLTIWSGQRKCVTQVYYITSVLNY